MASFLSSVHVEHRREDFSPLAGRRAGGHVAPSRVRAVTAARRAHGGVTGQGDPYPVTPTADADADAERRPAWDGGDR